MNTEQLAMTVVGLSIVNVVVLLIVLARVARISARPKETKQTPTAVHHHAAPTVSESDREALKATLQKKASDEADAAVKTFQKDLEAFSHALQTTLLNDATATMERQLAEPQKIIEQFNTSVTGTLESVTKSLEHTGETSQAELKAAVLKQQQFLIEQFEKQMATVINAYVVAALGDTAVDSDQLSAVVRQLEAHKEELRKDLLREA